MEKVKFKYSHHPKVMIYNRPLAEMLQKKGAGKIIEEAQVQIFVADTPKTREDLEAMSIKDIHTYAKTQGVEVAGVNSYKGEEGKAELINTVLAEESTEKDEE